MVRWKNSRGDVPPWPRAAHLDDAKADIGLNAG
jgi:hypothetical protein